MINQIKELRVKIDGLAQLTKELKPIINTLTEKQLKFYNEFYSDDDKTIKVTEYYSTKEIEKAVDSLYLAKAWLGKILGELNPRYCIAKYSSFRVIEGIIEYGNNHDELVEKCKTLGQNHSVIKNTPYANDGKRKTIEDIEDTADKGHIIVFEDFNHIEKVDWLREEIAKLMPINIQTYMTPSIIQLMNYVVQHLSEARFWLGFELERIKNT